MKLEDLFETPQNIHDTQFGLNNEQRNVEITIEWLQDKRKVAIKHYDNGRYTLYELPRAFLLVDHNNKYRPRIVYAMMYEVKFHKFIGQQCAQQVAVWRDIDDKVTIGITTHIFYDYLLKNYHTVVTDAQQTQDGAKFWRIRISEALDMPGVYVYYVDLLPHREIIRITDKTQFEKLRKEKDIWGDQHKHLARRLIITTKPLQETQQDENRTIV